MGLADLPTLADDPRRGKPQPKPTKMQSRVQKADTKQSRVEHEDRNKTKARKRDGWMCRFPRCVCHRLRLHPEVAHTVNKAMGGNPDGEKSDVSKLICLCPPRHQESRISLHRGTLKVETLTAKGTNGPVRWLVDVAALEASSAQNAPAQWVIVATETAVRVLEPLTHQQGALLERIAELPA